METAQLRLDLYRKQMALTRAAINILEAEYSAKGSGFDELLRLEEDLVDLELKTLQALVQSHVARSNIERLITP